MQALLAITDPGARALWEEALRSHGHALVSLTPGAVTPGAGERPRAHPPTIELAVVELAGDATIGLELCRQLRRETPNGRLSILALATADQPDMALAALGAGADDVLIGIPDWQAAAAHLTAMERRLEWRGNHSVEHHPPTVLLIDDEAGMRLPLRLALERYGYRVWEASNGMEGIELLARHGDEISLMLVDHHMPRQSGAEVIRDLRSRPRRIPVILMSGVALADTGLAPDVPDAFLHKPFKLVTLIRTVHALIGPAGARASNVPGGNATA